MVRYNLWQPGFETTDKSVVVFSCWNVIKCVKIGDTCIYIPNFTYGVIVVEYIHSICSQLHYNWLLTFTTCLYTVYNVKCYSLKNKCWDVSFPMKARTYLFKFFPQTTEKQILIQPREFELVWAGLNMNRKCFSDSLLDLTLRYFTCGHKQTSASLLRCVVMTLSHVGAAVIHEVCVHHMFVTGSHCLRWKSNLMWAQGATSQRLFSNSPLIWLRFNGVESRSLSQYCTCGAEYKNKLLPSPSCCFPPTLPVRALLTVDCRLKESCGCISSISTVTLIASPSVVV